MSWGIALLLYNILVNALHRVSLQRRDTRHVLGHLIRLPYYLPRNTRLTRHANTITHAAQLLKSGCRNLAGIGPWTDDIRRD